jgi:hypothetical protein
MVNKFINGLLNKNYNIRIKYVQIKFVLLFLYLLNLQIIY